MLTTDEARRLAATNSVPEPNTGCWLWLGASRTSGGGERYPTAKNVSVCRAILGLVERWEYACHMCDTPMCVNEDHLFRSTPLGNCQDMIAKQRDNFGGNRRKTHCKHGHEFSPENTRIDRRADGSERRGCRACHRIERQQWRDRQRQRSAA